jgi:ParB family chromosome partitioning protein
VYDMTKTLDSKTANDAAAQAADVATTDPTTDQPEGELVYLPLDILDFDGDNVRKSGGTNIDELKALIASQGMLQNLVVCPVLTKRGKPTGKYGVVAGGRRLRALRALAEEGKIAKNKDILCRIKPREEAIMVSAAENSGREPMTGADTLLAFAEMVRKGQGVEALSHSFGISVRTVERRMRLANASPKLFEMYAHNAISLDQLMALAVIDDHAKQEAVWEGASEWNRQPNSLRRAALGTAVSAATDRLARFVGVEAYKAAGGHVHADLFAEDDQGHMTDPELLSRLAGEKIAAERDQLLASGVAWVDCIESYDYSEQQKYTQPPTSSREPNKAEKKKIDAARKKLAAAEGAMQAYQDSADAEDVEEDEDRYGALEEAVDGAQGDLDELLGNLKSVSPEVEKLCGVVLTVDSNGQLRAHRNLVRKQDSKKATAVARSADVLADGTTPAPEEEEAKGLSEALLGRLAAQRSMALQVEVARNHHVALAVLAAALLSDLGLGTDSYFFSSISARQREQDLKMADPSIESSRAWSAFAAINEGAEAQLPQDEGAVLPWLLSQPTEVIVQLLAVCSAKSIYAGAGSLRRPNVDHIADAVGLDMTNYWTASGDTYFRSVPKALIAEAIAEVDPDKAKQVDKLKKGEAVTLAEEVLKDSRWLPVALRQVKAQ